MLEHNDYSYKFDEIRCASCEGNCCIGESGYIWITKSEIENLAKYLNMRIESLSDKYLFKVGYKYSIKEKQLSQENYACIFFDLNKKQCSIYGARPLQCRTFPFWEYFKNNIKELKQECPAIVE
ncbi:MAG: YkgJ family cysteine cluster protein [Campylobacterota bacterium]|nr:YkgJ family cysteine cluster protein [Campylobacterota bacterium]